MIEDPKSQDPNVEMSNDDGADPSADIAKQNKGQTPSGGGAAQADGAEEDVKASEAHPS